MADIVVTAASVAASTNAIVSNGGLNDLFGETVTAGQPLYRFTDAKLYKAKSDSAVHANCAGIALIGGAAGQPAIYQSGGKITIGGTAPAGTGFWVSDTAGGIQPSADVGAGEYCTFLGLGDGAGGIDLAIKAFGTAHA